MKFNVLEFLHFHRRDKVPKVPKSPKVSKIPKDKSSFFKGKEIKHKDKEIEHINPFSESDSSATQAEKNSSKKNQNSDTNIMRKSKSFNDLKQNVFTSLRRSTSYQRLSKNLNLSYTNLRTPLATLEENKLDLEDSHSLIRQQEPRSTILTEPSLAVTKEEEMKFDFATEGNTTNETYTSMFNSIYADYYLDSDSESIQSSAISDKKVVPPSEYLLSSSGTPNYNIVPQILPPFPSFVADNPFADFEEYNQLPHEKLLLRASQIHGLSPTCSLSSAIKSYRRSLYCESDDNDISNNDDDLIFYSNEKKSIVPFPQTRIPQSPLPALPQPSPLFSTPCRSTKGYDLVLPNIKREEVTDLEDKSLFDALSKAEWWDCSKITLVSYND